MCQKSPITVQPLPISCAILAASATWRMNGVSPRRRGSSTMDVPHAAAFSARRLPVFVTKSSRSSLRPTSGLPRAGQMMRPTLFIWPRISRTGMNFSTSASFFALSA